MSEAEQDDSRSLSALRARYGDNYRWWVLLTVMVGNMGAVMAATTINVAVPAISQRFGLGQHDAQWLATGFMAAMTLSMLTTSWLLDRFGYRRAYLVLLGVLGAGGVAGGLSNSIGWVLAMRVVEGLAAGVLQTIPGVVIMRAFARHEQGRAMGIFGFGTVLAPAIGPSVGGVLVAWFGWRAIFFFVFPFCIAAAWLARRYLPHAAPGGQPVNADAPRPDGFSLALLTAMLAALLNGLVEVHGKRPALGAGLLLLAVLLTLLFVRRQRNVAAPLLQLQLFGERVFGAAGVVSFVYGAGLFGSTYLLPLFMVVALGLPTTAVGTVLLPAGLALAVAIPLAGRLADRQPVWRAVVAGLAAMALSFVAMLVIGPASAIAWLAFWAVVGRIGLGFVIPSLNLGAMRALPPELISAGAGVNNFLRQLGGAVGVNLVGIVLEWRLQAYGSGGTLRAFHEVFLVMAGLTAVAAAFAWRMRTPGTAAPASRA